MTQMFGSICLVKKVRCFPRAFIAKRERGEGTGSGVDLGAVEVVGEDQARDVGR